MSDGQCDIGLIGLAVMGENLALNLEDKGYRVAVHNRSVEKVRTFLSERGRGKGFVPAESLEALVAALDKPRRIIMLVRAGAAVDALIGQIAPLLEDGDILIDGGNSLYTDTIRRSAALAARGLLYVGLGVSGGEEGALHGPSLMPGGNEAAWPVLKPMLEAICARTPAGEPCCHWIGRDGAGHFVKMVHNGIEYGDMQIICETYDLMRRGLGMANDAMADVFREWNAGELQSYLIAITGEILAYRDSDGAFVIDRILDAAGQKGTGKWAIEAAGDTGAPLTLIAEAVFARFLAASKDERTIASARIRGDVAPSLDGARGDWIGLLRQALYAAKIVSYAQGFQLLRLASATHDWELDLGRIALTWRAGCIIRSAFLGSIRDAYDRDRVLVNILLDPCFRDAVESRQGALRRVVAAAVGAGLPVPCLSAALAYWDGYRTERLPANLLQAQRDYFGAHTYERVDRPRGEHFHTDWTGRGGATTSESYSA